MNKSRIERDSMGEVKVPTTALYGAQTQRAINNFNASGQPMPKRFVIALLDILLLIHIHLFGEELLFARLQGVILLVD